MQAWLTIELVLAALLVTTFTCVGLVALWGATSPRHWFVRTAAVLGVLSVPLLIPAYEPLIVFALQTVVVLVGVAAWRWWAGRRTHGEIAQTELEGLKPRIAFRFSLITLLLFTPVVAVVVTLITKTVMGLTEQNFESVSTLALNGVASGCAVLLGAWILVSRRKWVAWSAALSLCLGIGAVMAWFDWLFASVVVYQSWPPDRSTVGLYMIEAHPELAWFAVVPAITATTWFLLGIWFAAAGVPAASCKSATNGSGQRDARRIAAVCIFGTLIFLFVLPLVLVTWRLSHPLPLPTVPNLKVNGLNDVVAAGRAFDSSPILNTSVKPKSTDELAAEVAKYSAAYDQLDRGMAKGIQVHTWPAENLMSMITLSSIQELRSAARGLMRKAELAQQQSRFADAVRISLQNMRLGQATARDGLLIDYHVGIAIEGIGQHTLHRVISQLDAAECRRLIVELAEIDRDRERVMDTLERDRAWTEHAYGWWGRLYGLLEDIAPTYDMRETYVAAEHRTQAASRLLMLEAALRLFQLEHGEFPNQLDDIGFNDVAELPADPFDPLGGLLRYLRTDGGYVVYSIGFDGDDDGGRPQARDEYGSLDFYGDGDLRLDEYFVEESTESSDEAADDNHSE
jgi:hypothetical protein